MQDNLILRDVLALDRTKLANLRTFLAFLRTGLYLFVTAFAVMKVEFLKDLSFLGWGLMGIGSVVIVIGIINYWSMKKKIQKHYK